MATLSENEAKDIVKIMLPIIRETIINRNEAYVISITGMKEAFDSVRREGNTPDVYCKIAEAASKYGLSVDIKPSLYHGMTLGFNHAKPGYKKPSPRICESRWRNAKKLSDTLKKEGERKFFQKHPEYLK